MHIITEKIKEIALQAGQQHSCRLYDLYKNRDGLQILIDKATPSEKVSLQDCEKVFRSFSFLLEAEFPELSKKWRLEVSTPGLEKKLREEWHFEESVGETIKIKTSSLVESKNTSTNKTSQSEFFKAKLVSFSEGILEFKEEDREWKIPLSKVQSAQVIFISPKFSKNKKINKPKNKKRG